MTAPARPRGNYAGCCFLIETHLPLMACLLCFCARVGSRAGACSTLFIEPNVHIYTIYIYILYIYILYILASDNSS